MRNPIIRVQLSWRHQFEFAPFYAAFEKGFYKDFGLDVVLVEGGPEIDTVDRVVSGEADLGVANSGLLLSRAEGQPVIALSALMQHSAFALVAKRASGIETVQDLAGRSVACAPHACPEIKAYLRASGLPDEAVNYVSMKSSDLEENLALSDAVDIFITNQGFEVSLAPEDYTLLIPRSAGIDFYGDILFASESVVISNRELINQVRLATNQGLEYAYANREEIVELIISKYNTQSKSREQLLFEAEKLFELVRPDLIEPGYMSGGRWRFIRDVYAGLGMIPADFAYESMLVKPDVQVHVPGWVYWTLLGGAVVLVVVALVALRFRQLILALRKEVSERVSAERTLRHEQVRFQKFVETAIGMISHELKTPLAVMNVHLDLLRLKSDWDVDASKNYLAITQAASRLHQLFNKNLQDVLASTSFVSRRESVNVFAAIRKSVNGHVGLNDNMMTNYAELDCRLTVHIAPELFDTIIASLIENAAKYSVAKTPLVIRAVKIQDHVRIEFENDSRLPLDDDLAPLLRKNNRGAAGAGTEGSGMGLYFISQVVEANEGRVEVYKRLPNKFCIACDFPQFKPTTQS